MIPLDVIVVGAGLSGLVCARELVQCGMNVLVVEARDRVGGRTLSRRLGGAMFDLGGQWLGPRQSRVTLLAEQLGVGTFPTHVGGKSVFCGRSGRVTYAGTIPRISLLGLAGLGVAIARLEFATGQSGKGSAQPWFRTPRPSAADLLPGWTPRDGRAAFDAAIRTVFGADPEELSLAFAAGYAASAHGFFSLVDVVGGAQERRFVAGAQELSIRLARPLPPGALKLGNPVTSIAHTDTGVEVATANEAWRAKRAVVAIPPPLLARIAFDPPLPAERLAVVSSSRMGKAIKVHALYPRAFWRDEGFSGEAVFADGPLSVVFDNSAHAGLQPALVGFIVGSDVDVWRDVGDQARRTAVLESLRTAFGVDALRPILYVEHDWGSEEFSAGCPVAFLPSGGGAADYAAVREPLGRIHWAGTEMARRYPGYLDGAVEAGQRAAAEVATSAADEVG